MAKYKATITHHSIGQARIIEIEGSLTKAKREATKEFGGGFIDHRIVICNEHNDTVATRRIGEKGWT